MLAQEFAPASQAGEDRASGALEARTAHWVTVGAGIIKLTHSEQGAASNGGAA